MKTRKPMALILSGAVCVLLALLAVFFLVYSIRGYGQVRGELDQARADLARLVAGDPAHGNRFPSESNVEITDSNLKAGQAAFAELFGAFAGTPNSTQDVEPARFPLLLDQTLRGLNEKAAVNNVVVPDRFAYGFDQYASALPVKGDIPRLSRQLICVEAACRALFEQRVVELVRVQRQPFDAPDIAAASKGRPTPTRTAPGTAPVQTLLPGEYRHPTGLYYRERVLVTFRSHEANIWNTLNALVKLSPFCIVSDLTLENRAGAPGSPNSESAGDPMNPGAGGDPLAGAVEIAEKAKTARILPHKERIVAGQSDVIDITLGLDFIRFEPLGTDEQKRSSL